METLRKLGKYIILFEVLRRLTGCSGADYSKNIEITKELLNRTEIAQYLSQEQQEELLGKKAHLTVDRSYTMVPGEMADIIDVDIKLPNGQIYYAFDGGHKIAGRGKNNIDKKADFAYVREKEGKIRYAPEVSEYSKRMLENTVFDSAITFGDSLLNFGLEAALGDGHRFIGYRGNEIYGVNQESLNNAIRKSPK